PPTGEVRESTYEVQDGAMEVSALGREADLLLAPVSRGDLKVDARRAQGELRLDLLPDGHRVVDGFQKTHGEREAGMASRFSFVHEVEGALVQAEGAERVHVAGDALAYLWDAHIQLRDESGVVESFQTGLEVRSGIDGTITQERYTYILVEIDGLTTTLHPGLTRLTLQAPALAVGLDGGALLPRAVGSLEGETARYEAPGTQDVDLTGNLTLDVAPTPRPTGDPRTVRTTPAPDRLAVHVDGELRSVNLAAIETGPDLRGPAVAASAGGVTLLGLAAAWYAMGAKGASLAILASRRREGEEEQEAASVDPAELLFDSERFTLYHLIRSNPGLTASTCKARTGIRSADQALELLAMHGLLEASDRQPQRFWVPGSLPADQLEDVLFLRDDQVLAVARLLVLHGLTPVGDLVARARDAEPGIPERRTRAILSQLIARDLVIEEPGQHGWVVDPSPTLHERLERMGASPLRSSA
ncbi:MAG: hypothetical protein R3185_05965, partial [Candidatus Thermoplasmatota archaeon]|nr:hypothetical protein [Candidatus Thermoplasmatota archaeon]